MMPRSLTALRLTMADLLARYSITVLRISLGLVFFGFGILKLFDRSPAQNLAERTTEALTFGLISGTAAGILVAALECTIGICLVTRRQVRLGLGLLAVAFVGILSPLVLFPDDLFAGKDHAPTLEGQYVLKDVVLVASGLVIAARELGGRPLAPRSEPIAVRVSTERRAEAGRSVTWDHRS